MIVFVYNYFTYAYEAYWSVIICHICLRVHIQSCLFPPFFFERLQIILFYISLKCFSSVQSRPTLCNPMDSSTPDLPVCDQLLELAQTHVHRVGDAIHPPHPPVVPFSSCLQSFPASGSFPMNQFFASGGQRIEMSASVLPMNIQDWFPLGLTRLISLQWSIH